MRFVGNPPINPSAMALVIAIGCGHGVRSSASPTSSASAPPASSPSIPSNVAPGSTTPGAELGDVSADAAIPRLSPSARQWLEEQERSFRNPPVQVTQELEYVEKNFPMLPVLGRLPDFLSVNDVLKLAAGHQHDREGLRDAIHSQLDSHDGDPENLASVLRGDPLDEAGTWYALWLGVNQLESVLAIYDQKGVRRERRLLENRSRILVRDVLRHGGAEADAVKELIVQEITSPSVCCLPIAWTVYRVAPWGKLISTLTHAKGDVEVGPGARHTSLYHFDFSLEAGTVAITNVLTPEPPRRFRYRAAVGRYVEEPHR